jgi:hypothetical protein
MLKRLLTVAALLFCTPVFAQQGVTGFNTVTNCGSESLTAGIINPGSQNVTGSGCVTAVPTTTGGPTFYFVQPTASDNHANIKNGAGQVYKIAVTNNSSTTNYLRLYDAGSGFNGCNSATNLIYQMAILPLAGFIDTHMYGMPFATGISICVTSGYATNDTTNATASAMSVNVGYK